MTAAVALDRLLTEAIEEFKVRGPVMPEPSKTRLVDAVANAQAVLSSLSAKMARIGPALETANKAVTGSVERLEAKAQEAIQASNVIDELTGQLHDLTTRLTNMGEGSEASSKEEGK